MCEDLRVDKFGEKSSSPRSIEEASTKSESGIEIISGKFT